MRTMMWGWWYLREMMWLCSKAASNQHLESRVYHGFKLSTPRNKPCPPYTSRFSSQPNLPFHVPRLLPRQKPPPNTPHNPHHKPKINSSTHCPGHMSLPHPLPKESRYFAEFIFVFLVYEPGREFSLFLR